MLRIEEYIARRKKEDQLNELDIGARLENIKVCVNYVFEYFNNCLDITPQESQTVLHNEKIEKYKKQLEDYDLDIQNWLIDIYAEYGFTINRTIGNQLKKNEFLFLLNSDQEFRSVSYECYSQLIKKHPFLKNQSEMLFLFIKDHHRVISEASWRSGIPFISDGINEWIQNTWNKYQVNVVAFSEYWVDYFWDHPEIWPPSHRIKSQDTWIKYEYDFKQESNLFNLNSLYARMPKKPYTKGRKQEFEILMMYFWLHNIEGDDEGYWQQYIEKVIPSMLRLNKTI